MSYAPARTAAAVAVAVLPPAPTAAAARRTAPVPVPVRHAADQVGPIEIPPVTAGCMAVYRDPAGYLAGDRGATAVVQVHRQLEDGRWSVTFPCTGGGWPRWPETVHGDYLVAIPPQALMADVTAAVTTAAAAGVRGPALLRALAAAC
ncbi:hypothetical protein [Streptomyces bohaiensis]|uniref:hypothetical protein n=1 Tax=Streptomyces bohaiensis TaxID=1431344 RepID=UPI003B9EDB50